VADPASALVALALSERRQRFGASACPCCGYPTLRQRAQSELCLLCDWEDDGQDDTDAGELRGGPNGDLSLSEARENFADHWSMYDAQTAAPLQGIEEIEAKRALAAGWNSGDEAAVQSAREALTAALRRRLLGIQQRAREK
jgi:hypothetical protein